MKNSSVVSVIMPIYNHANFIRRAIDSVLMQTYPYWELIIWDDGSTDNSEEIITSYQDNRIKYFKEENRGVSYARNRAIEHSIGDYIAFLDSDDEWLEEKLAVQVNVLDNHIQIDILFSDFYNINDSTNEKYRTFSHYSKIMKSLEVEQFNHGLFIIKNGILESISRDNFIATDTIIVRREKLAEIGLFNEDLRNSVDFELWWRMGLAGVRFSYYGKVLLIRHKLPGSLSSPGLTKYQNSLKCLDICKREALLSNRCDLAVTLNHRYRNIWQNLISMHASRGEKEQMWNAFFRSLEFGINLGSIRLLIQGLYFLTRI
ncbi:glycosyltransferase [Chloroflexota bacterium]